MSISAHIDVLRLQSHLSTSSSTWRIAARTWPRAALLEAVVPGTLTRCSHQVTVPFSSGGGGGAQENPKLKHLRTYFAVLHLVTELVFSVGHVHTTYNKAAPENKKFYIESVVAAVDEHVSNAPWNGPSFTNFETYMSYIEETLKLATPDQFNDAQTAIMSIRPGIQNAD